MRANKLLLSNYDRPIQLGHSKIHYQLRKMLVVNKWINCCFRFLKQWRRRQKSEMQLRIKRIFDSRLSKCYPIYTLRYWNNMGQLSLNWALIASKISLFSYCTKTPLLYLQCFFAKCLSCNYEMHVWKCPSCRIMSSVRMASTCPLSEPQGRVDKRKEERHPFVASVYLINKYCICLYDIQK